jgi:hypothetical protein
MQQIKLSSARTRRGSVLLTTLVFGGISCLMLISCLTLVQTRSIYPTRSLAWNSAIPLAEGGIEEAFTHMTDDKGNLTANGWASASGGTFQKRRDFTDTSYCIVTISNAATAMPVIFSQGFVPGPFGKGYISRLVKVTTATAGTSLFNKAILARGAITFAGDMQVNSFDSSNTNYSNADGTYNPARTLANGGVASMAGSGVAIKIAGSKIYGKIQYPAGDTYTIGSGAVGDQAFVDNAANAGTIEAGYSDNTLNVTVPDAPTPNVSSWATLVSTPYTWTNGVTYAYVMYNDNYKLLPGTTLKGSILVLGTAQLYIPIDGRIQFGSADVIKVPTTSSFQMQNASSSDAVFTGVSNDSGLATHFYYWGLSTTTGSKLSLTGNGQFAGAIYAANQKVVLTGSSSSLPRDFIGALVADTVVNSGHFYMSYDQALGNAGTGNPTLVSYREL